MGTKVIRNLFVVLVISLFLISILNLESVSAKSKTITVTPGKSIQAAIDSASPGDTILVKAGTYQERVIVSKQLTLKGDKAVLDLATVNFPPFVAADPIHPGNAGIYVEASGVTVSGFTIKNVPFYPAIVEKSLPYAFGIRFAGSSSNGVIENNIVDSAYIGIGVISPFDTSVIDYPEISNVKVLNNKISATFGIFIINTRNIMVQNNQVTARTSPDPTYASIAPQGMNFFNINTAGGLIPIIEGISVRNNIVNSERSGISINGAAGLGISNVDVQLNKVTAVTAISISNCRNLAIKGNYISAVAIPAAPTAIPSGIVVGQNSVATPTLISDVSIQSNIVNSEGLGITLNGLINVGILNAVVQYNVVSAKPSEVITGLNPTSVLYAIQAQNTPNVVIRVNVLSVKTTLSPITLQLMGQPVGIRLNQAFSGGLVEFNAINSEFRGIQVNAPSNIKVQYNWIYSSIVGIDLPNAPDIEVKNNIISAKANSLFTHLPNGIMAGGNIANGLIEKNRIESGYFGIWMGGSPNVKICNNIVSKAVFAIQANNALNVVISGNTLEAKTNPTDYPVATPNGVLLSGGSSGALIENNKITSDYFGIWLDGSSNVVVRSNTVYTAIFAIQANNAPNILVADNVVSAKANVDYPGMNPNGIFLSGSFSGGIIDNNVINSERYGILIGQPNIQILNNKVYTSTVAIQANNVPNIIISGNTLSAQNSLTYGNANGIVLSGAFSVGLIDNNEINSEFNGIGMGGGAKLGIQILNNKVYTSIFAINVGNAPAVVIKGNELTAKRNASYTNNPNGVILSGSPGALIENNKITSDYFGIWIMGSSNVRIQVNTIYTALIGIRAAYNNNPGVVISDNIVTAKTNLDYPTQNAIGVSLQGINSGGSIEDNEINSDYYGIALETSTTGTPPATTPTFPQDVVIKDNKVFTSLYAIYAFGARSVTVTGNELNAVTNGIRLNAMGNTPVTVNDNIVTSGSTTIYADSVTNSLIQGNTVQVNLGTGTLNYGIALHGSHSTISGNTISGDFTGGVAIGGGLAGALTPETFDITISGNTITGGSKSPDYAFHFWPTAHDNLATGNTVSGVDQVYQDDSSYVPSNNIVE